MNLADRGMSLGLRALNRFAGLEVIDRLGMRAFSERTVQRATKNGFRAAGAIGRTFAAQKGQGGPARQRSGSGSGQFDLTPSDEQQMMQEAAREFAAAELRPAAEQADTDAAPPAGLIASAAELGTTLIGIPEEHGGAVEERSAVTSVLMAEAFAHGDLSLAFATLAPAAVSTAIGLWGDADQQATYLREFAGENVPGAALAVQEPRPLFDPFALATTARRDGGEFVLNGVKSLVPGVATAELFVVAAAIDAVPANGVPGQPGRPALFIVESKLAGVQTAPEPGMGLRAARTGQLILDEVRVPASALLADGDPTVYAEAIRLGRIAWAALATGTAQAALDYVIPYVNERQAFGEPISHRQGVAFAVSNLAIDVDSLRLTTYRAAGRVDLGKDFARESALARRLTADKGMEIGSQAVQLLGGHGYVKDHPVERWYRDLRAAGLMEGALLV